MSWESDGSQRELELEQARLRRHLGAHTVGPAPVDDPAPWATKNEGWSPWYERERAEQIQRRMQEAQLASMYERSAERRLTIAAKFMAGQIVQLDYTKMRDIAAWALRGADALLAEWKASTPSFQPHLSPADSEGGEP